MTKIIGCRPNNVEPFSLEEHQQIGENLKRQFHSLESLSRRIERPVVNSKAIQKDIGTALKALDRVKQSLHTSMMNDFTQLPDEELLPIYLGRLEQPKGGSDNE
jgi:hypothetical protein